MTQAITPDHPIDSLGDHAGDHSGEHGHGHNPYLAHHFDTEQQQFNSAKLGIWLFLATEVLMFGGLFCAYAIYRANHPEVFQFQHVYLDTFWGATNTAILLASSFTMAWGVRAAQLGQKTLLSVLLALTLCGGCGFMVIKYIEYSAKWEHALWVGGSNAFFWDTQSAGGFKYAQPEEGEHASKLEHSLEYREKALAKRYGVGGYDEDHAPGHADGHAPGHADSQGETHAGKPVESAEHDGDAGHGTETAHGDGQAAPADSFEATADANPAGPMPVADSLAASQGTAALAPIEASTIHVPAFGPAGTSDDLLVADADHGVGAHTGHHAASWEDLSQLEQERAHIFFQIYFMMTGLHGIHVLIGVGLIGYLFVRSLRGVYHTANFAAVDVIGLYWHLVDLIWIFLFPLLYLIH